MSETEVVVKTGEGVYKKIVVFFFWNLVFPISLDPDCFYLPPPSQVTKVNMSYPTRKLRRKFWAKKK